MNAAEVTDKLGLHSLRNRNWYIQATCATSGDGLYEGMLMLIFVPVMVVDLHLKLSSVSTPDGCLRGEGRSCNRVVLALAGLDWLSNQLKNRKSP